MFKLSKLQHKINWFSPGDPIIMLLLCLLGPMADVWAKEVVQSQRSIPVIQSVDVVVVGGSTAGVSAATAAAETGAKVFLIAPRLYLGEDICATLRLQLQKDRTLKTDLEKNIFSSGTRTTPMQVKRTLDEVLVNFGVKFLFGCYATDILWDKDNKIGGIVIANRAGRQAIVAKVIIDATDRACLCRMAGAKAYPWQGGKLNFRRVTVIADQSGQEIYVEKEFSVSMPNLNFSSFAEAEQIARDQSYVEGQLRASESLFCVPADPIVCRNSAKTYNEAKGFHVGHFQPEGIDRLYLLSGCADIARAKAEELLRPAAMIAVGKMVGSEAAAKALSLAEPCGVRVRGACRNIATKGDIKEILQGARPVDSNLKTIVSEPCPVPILAEYDVVIVGGGTSGAPAAIAAVEQNARVLVVEYQEGLGGVGTLGMIGKPYRGIKTGFSNEVPFTDSEHNLEHKIEWYRRRIRKAGGTIWFGVLGCGAFVEGNQIKGVVVVTPEGRGVVLGKVVIDATGNADIAIAAGAQYMYGALEKGQIAMQGAGYPQRPLKKNYVNTDYVFVDESDMVNVWATLVGARLAMSEKGLSSNSPIYDVGTMLQTRERRRIVGDHILRYLDQIAHREYPDSIVLSRSDYDCHGYSSDPYFALLPHDNDSRKQQHPGPAGSCFTPYRCLLPKGLDGILVTGLGISMERDASALMRMQYDIQNQGYAAGVAAALAVKEKLPPRSINVRTLQKHLVGIGNLSASVLTHQDSFPLPKSEIEQAVADMGKATNPKTAGTPLAIILTHQTTALLMLKSAYDNAQGKAKLLYAQILAFLGAKEVVPTLISELSSITEWDNKINQGLMAEYGHMPTPIDSIILAIGYTGDRSATPALIKMLDQLDEHVPLSHHRSLALALEQLRDPAVAEPLAKLLQKPNMHGYCLTELKPLHDKPMSKRRRTESLREIILSRALYHCGDYQGLGEKILRQYTHDFRGLFARHAKAVLSENNRN